MTKKTVLITGCEGQLGSEYVALSRELGHEVVGFDMPDITKHSDIVYRKTDITNSSSIASAISDLPKIDVLINNAGAAVFSPFEERTAEELDFVIDVNLKGTILMTQAIFNKFMKPNNQGCVINIGSIYGVVSGDMRLYKEGDRRTSEIYGATKAAIINLTLYWAAYMAPFNVRVNCLSPGGVFNHQAENFVTAYENKTPLGRMAKASEMRSTIRYLIDDDSSYVTGQNIVVDGGFTAW